MQISMQLSYSGGFKESADMVAELEAAGLDLVWVAEAYGFDGVSLMGYIAAKTEKVQIAAGILPISWAYVRMMGAQGLTTATAHAVLSANYIAARLDEHFPVLYRGHGGLVLQRGPPVLAVAGHCQQPDAGQVLAQ